MTRLPGLGHLCDGWSMLDESAIYINMNDKLSVLREWSVERSPVRDLITLPFTYERLCDKISGNQLICLKGLSSNSCYSVDLQTPNATILTAIPFIYG